MSGVLPSTQVAVVSSTKAYKNGIHVTGAISMVLGALIIALSTIWFSNLKEANSSATICGAYGVSLIASIVQAKGTLILFICGLQERLKTFVIICAIAFLGSSVLLAATLHKTVNAKVLLGLSYDERLLEEDEATAVIITAGLNIIFNAGLVIAHIINTGTCRPDAKEVPYSIMA